MNTLALVLLIVLFGFSCQHTRNEQSGKMNPDTTSPAEKAFYVILKEPVQVIAEYNPKFERLFLQARIIIRYRRQEYRLDSNVFAGDDSNLPGAIERLKGTIGWKSSCLFVSSECGGSNAWRCERDYIFKLNGEDLIYVGNIVADSDRGPGSNFKNDHFEDVFDRLEGNSLTSHAGAPYFMIFLEETQNRLAPNLQRTWELNYGKFYSLQGKIETFAASEKPTDWKDQYRNNGWRFLSTIYGNEIQPTL